MFNSGNRKIRPICWISRSNTCIVQCPLKKVTNFNDKYKENRAFAAVRDRFFIYCGKLNNLKLTNYDWHYDRRIQTRFMFTLAAFSHCSLTTGSQVSYITCPDHNVNLHKAKCFSYRGTRKICSGHFSYPFRYQIAVSLSLFY